MIPALLFDLLVQDRESCAGARQARDRQVEEPTFSRALPNNNPLDTPSRTVGGARPPPDACSRIAGSTGVARSACTPLSAQRSGRAVSKLRGLYNCTCAPNCG